VVAAIALAGAGFLFLGAGSAGAQEGDGAHVTISEESEHCIALLEEGKSVADCQKSPSPIAPATNEIIWGGLAFLGLLVGLWKFGIPAATKMMDERTERIRGDLDTADKARSEAETVLANYRSQLKDSQTESARIIDEARGQADQVRRDLIARAEAEAAELRARNVEQLAGERERVLGELRGQVASLAVELAEKVVESNLDRDANLVLIENYINSVGSGDVAGSR
jgi:F-type H+-transporting ATPase subunit b